MSFELFDVGTVKGLPAVQILAPLRDLFLERLIAEGIRFRGRGFSYEVYRWKTPAKGE